MFSWRVQSAQIFDKITTSSADDVADESESEDEVSYCNSTLTGDVLKEKEPLVKKLSDEEIDERLRRWTDLTNIEMGPYSSQALLHKDQKQDEDGDASEFGTDMLQNKHKTSDTHAKSDRHKRLSSGNVLPSCPSAEAELHFKFQYLIMSEKLKVTLVKAYNLMKDSESEDEITTYAKLCLMPGKSQQKSTEVVPGTKNPEFGSVFFFKGLTLQEMHQMTLRIILYGRDQANGPYSNLGEVTVYLDDFDITAETVLTELVNTRICSNPSGNGSVRIRIVR